MQEKEIIGGGGGALKLSPIEKLAIAQAFYKNVANLVSTKSPGSLRDECNELYKGLYEQTGAKSFDMKVLGEKVGTFSLTVSEDKPSETRVELEVKDDAALFEWARENGFLAVDMDSVTGYFEDTGEVPGGCEPVAVAIPAVKGGEVTKTTLKIDEHAVLSALGTQLETVSYALLEGAE